MGKFIAAMDHSGGSTGEVLERYGQAYTEEDKMDKVHEMRLRMVNSPDFNSDNIWAAILYKDTVESTDATGHTTMKPVSWDYRFSNL